MKNYQLAYTSKDLWNAFRCGVLIGTFITTVIWVVVTLHFINSI
jgi:hypothetical protein